MTDDITAHGLLLCDEGNKEGAEVGNMQAVKFYHEEGLRMKLALDRFKVKAVRKGSQRVHINNAGSQMRARRP